MNNMQITEYQKAIKNYKGARYDVLAIIVFTVINLFASIGGYYFLFSIYFSTLAFSLGFALNDPAVCAEIGIEYSAEFAPYYIASGIVVGLVVLAVYLVFWFLSKKHNWATVVLFVLMAADTLFVLADMLTAGDYMMIIDFVIHAIMLIYLGIGMAAGFKLKKAFPDKGVAVTYADLEHQREDGPAPYFAQSAPVSADKAEPFAELSKESKPSPEEEVFPELGGSLPEQKNEGDETHSDGDMPDPNGIDEK